MTRCSLPRCASPHRRRARRSARPSNRTSGTRTTASSSSRPRASTSRASFRSTDAPASCRSTSPRASLARWRPSTVSDIAWFEWVNDDRLVFTIVDRQVGGGAQRGSGLYTVKRDGGEFGCSPVRRPSRDSSLNLLHADAGAAARRLGRRDRRRQRREPPLPRRLPPRHRHRQEDAGLARQARAMLARGWPIARAACASRSPTSRVARRARTGARPRTRPGT